MKQFLSVVIALLFIAGCGTQDKAQVIRGDNVKDQSSSSHLGRESEKPKSKVTLKAALLVPLTGPHKTMGHALKDAATLALSLTDSVAITIHDSGNTDAEAAAAAHAALAEKPSIILGPVFAGSTQVVSAVVSEHTIPVISFTNNRKIIDAKTLSFGFQPEEQLERVLHFAGSKGITEFFALLPSNDYGKIAEASIRKEIQQLGGALLRVEFYTDTSESKKLAAEAIRASLKTSIHDNPEAMHRGLIMIEGGHHLAELTSILNLPGLPADSVRLLGSGQWDDDATLSIPGMHGAWFASASPQKHQRFVQLFSDHYHYQPPWIASLAFDAIGLIQAIARTKEILPPAERKQTITTAELFQPQGFIGVDGIFRFQSPGYTERGLAIIEVQAEGFMEIDPAPEHF